VNYYLTASLLLEI